MSENATFQSYIDDAEELIDDEEYDYTHYRAYSKSRFYILMCYLPFEIVVGLVCNILILAILIRRRLWISHEAYLYLAAILLINSLKLMLTYGDWWLNLFNRRLIRMSTASDISCKLRKWLVVSCNIDWLHVLLLLNVCLRQQLTTRSDGRGGCGSLSAKYCTLFGTKVILGSYFTVCIVANFWSFALISLQIMREAWHCYNSSSDHYAAHLSFIEVWRWLGLNTSWPFLAVLLVITIWKRKRNSGFVFSQMNGDSQNDGDVEALTRIAIACSAATCITSAIEFLCHVLYLILPLYRQPRSRVIIIAVMGSLELIHFVEPLLTAVVCLAVKSRLRDDLKSIIGRCFYGSSCKKTLPSEPGIDRSSVLQMNPIEDDTQRDEDSRSLPTIIRI